MQQQQRTGTNGAVDGSASAVGVAAVSGAAGRRAKAGAAGQELVQEKSELVARLRESIEQA